MRFILRVWLQPSAYVDEEGVPFVLSEFTPIKQRVCLNLHALKERVLRWIKPLTTSLVLETFADLTRGKAELLAENTLLRHQLIILRRQVKRPVYKKTDRFLLVFLAGMVRAWKRALFLVQPETLLRWHRELFRLFWKHKSKAQARKPRLSLETISLIKDMAANNRLWGAERIRGELLKLNMNVLITSSFSMRNNSPGFSWRMQCTSIIPDLIKESISRSRLC